MGGAGTSWLLVSSSLHRAHHFLNQVPRGFPRSEIGQCGRRSTGRSWGQKAGGHTLQYSTPSILFLSLTTAVLVNLQEDRRIAWNPVGPEGAPGTARSTTVWNPSLAPLAPPGNQSTFTHMLSQTHNGENCTNRPRPVSTDFMYLGNLKRFRTSPVSALHAFPEDLG